MTQTFNFFSRLVSLKGFAAILLAAGALVLPACEVGEEGVGEEEVGEEEVLEEEGLGEEELGEEELGEEELGEEE